MHPRLGFHHQVCEETKNVERSVGRRTFVRPTRSTSTTKGTLTSPLGLVIWPCRVGKQETP